MTRYLIDENVLREMHPNGNARVKAWIATVNDDDIRISVVTFLEKRIGAERLRKRDPERAAELLAAIAAAELLYGARIVPIDAPIVAEWARLLGAKQKNQRDRALAATARVRGFVLVTRNIEDVRGCDVHVLDPFVGKPTIKLV